jgi:hypothetical protein
MVVIFWWREHDATKDRRNTEKHHFPRREKWKASNPEA